jgi:hypothetical protein
MLVMDDAQTPRIESETERPRSVPAAVERLFAGATDALNRAASCNDPGWQKFYLGQAAAYKEWARQMEPLVGLQARIDDQVEMLRQRLNLPPLPQRGAGHIHSAIPTESEGSDPRSVQDASN